MADKEITIKDGDEILYQGPCRRGTSMSEKTYFGLFTFRDIVAGMIYVFSVVVTITIFWVKTDYRIQTIENNTTILTGAVDKLTTFKNNSDTWHTSITGNQFENGRPLESRLNIRKSKIYQ